MRALVASVPLLIALAVAGVAQPVTPNSSVLSPLPSPALPESDRPSDFLQAAQGALATGRLRETQEALEMAQTRMLDRSVALGQTNTPSNDPAVSQISDALRALAEHDRASCMQSIQAAIASTRAEGH